MRDLSPALWSEAQQGTPYHELLLRAGEALRRRVPFVASIWTTIDPVTLLPTGWVAGDDMPLDIERIQRLVRYELENVDPGSMLDLLARPTPVFGLREHVADPMTVTRYREVTQPLGSYDELRLALIDEGHPWGMLVLHRGEWQGAFTAADLEYTARLAPILGRVLRLAFLRAACAAPAGLEDPPGQLVLRAGEGIVSATPSALDWVERFGGEAAFMLATTGLRGAVETGGTSQVTLTTERGPVAIHGDRLSGSDDIALMIERPRPLELTRLISSAYGLSSRERHVAELVLRGRSTKEITADLGISAYTVQDHLKAIFAKTSTGTRAQLQWALSSRFYLPPTAERLVPGPYGFYLDSEQVTRVLAIQDT